MSNSCKHTLVTSVGTLITTYLSCSADAAASLLFTVVICDSKTPSAHQHSISHCTTSGICVATRNATTASLSTHTHTHTEFRARSEGLFYLSLTTPISGDGANDVSMIQVADVGVGISGQEGMQVRRIGTGCCGGD